MSKSLKKIAKVGLKVVTVGASGSDGWGSKAVGALSGGLVGDSSVYGSSGGLSGLLGGGQAAGMDNLAKTQMAIANQQAEQASKEARDAADSNILSLKADLEKNQAAKAAAELNPVDDQTADVDLATQGNNASTRRKKYSTSSVSSGSGGPAIRI
jgi:hypothetical protein